MANGTSNLVLPAIEPTLLPVIGGGQFPVRRIYCVGRNYVSHIREMKEADERDPPFFFQKPRDSIVGDNGVVPYPPDTDDFQFEGELVAVIGKDGRNIPVAQALDHVWGYAIGLDMTRRDRQRDARDKQLPWEPGKSFDASAPCGAVYPAAKIGHPSSGAITLAVNGEEKQRGDLKEMIWSVPEIVAKLSEQYEMKAGDIIMTGTPAGVGPVQPGDRVVTRVEGVGEFVVTIGAKQS